MSVSKPRDENLFEQSFRAYVRLLRTKPVLTKAVTSSMTAMLGNLISQLVDKNRKTGIQWRSLAAFAAAGLLYTGPLIHYFYIWMDKAVPKHIPYAMLKRILLDRFVFAPPFLFVYFFLLGRLEGQSSSDALKKIHDIFWTTLKMNWKIWTPLQFININYVPQQFRVLFSSVVALFWTVYVALSRK